MEKKISEEIKEGYQKLNLDAPYADVDPEAADMPEEVVKDL